MVLLVGFALVAGFLTCLSPCALPVLPAVLAGGATAAVAAPARWEVSLLRFAQPVQPTDLLTDLLVSIAWGALAGLAGATILRPRLAALMRDNRP